MLGCVKSCESGVDVDEGGRGKGFVQRGGKEDKMRGGL